MPGLFYIPCVELYNISIPRFDLFREDNNYLAEDCHDFRGALANSHMKESQSKFESYKNLFLVFLFGLLAHYSPIMHLGGFSKLHIGNFEILSLLQK